MACSFYVNLAGVRAPLEGVTDAASARAQIVAREGTAALVFTADGLPLTDAAVASGATIALAEQVDGGAKGKKKKKNYTTPKHVPHKRRKVKLAVLKYYGIEDNKILNLRVDCVDKCPDGVKMASHPDRSHCGRCGVTIFKEAQ